MELSRCRGGTGGLRPGRLFRSGELSQLDDDGRDNAAPVGVTDVADLRSEPKSTAADRDWFPTASTIHLLPVPDSSQTSRVRRRAPHEHAFQKMLTEKPTTSRSGTRPAAT